MIDLLCGVVVALSLIMSWLMDRTRRQARRIEFLGREIASQDKRLREHYTEANASKKSIASHEATAQARDLEIALLRGGDSMTEKIRVITLQGVGIKRRPHGVMTQVNDD